MVAVVTQHNDVRRTGANLDETLLTTANVNGTTFGLLFSRAVDGHIYAQPLYVPALTMPGVGKHDVVFVATMHNTVYAFDGDDPSAAEPLWERSLESPASLPDANIGANCHPYHDIFDSIGIVSTPVIDLQRNTMYLVTFTRVGTADSPAAVYQHWLHALDIRTGADMAGSPVQIVASAKGNGRGAIHGTLTFDSKYQNQRCALLLVGGVVYIAFASYCDTGPYHGWVLGYDQLTLHQRGVFLTTPNGAGGGIWQAGQGLASGPGDYIYLISGNGTFDSASADFGDSIVKLNPNLSLADWFTPYNQQQLDAADDDLGSAGPLLIPGTRLLLGGGKEGKLYLLNRGNMGHFNPAGDTQITQSFQASGVPDMHGNQATAGTHHIHGSPVYWPNGNGGKVYIWAENDWLRAYSFDGHSFPPQPGLLNIGDKAVLNETTIGRPVLANQADVRILAAWTGTDGQNHINVGLSANGHTLSNKMMLGEKSVDGPGLAVGTLRSYVAWTGTDIARHLNVMSTADANTFVNKTTLAETSPFGPALAFGDGRLFLAWVGSDKENFLNIMSSTDGVTFVNKVTLTESTASSPSLSFIDGTLYLLWRGRDSNQHLNIMSSTDGVHFTNRVTLDESSRFAPALTEYHGQMCLAWTGRDGHLNVRTGSSPATLTNKFTLAETAHSGPSLAVFEGQILVAWMGTDATKHLNIANLQGQPQAVTSQLLAPPGMPGAMLSVSAHGMQPGTGILWASLPKSGDANHNVVAGVLRAFDAADVSHELWNSEQNPDRDSVGNFAKFCPPTIADGKVFLGTFSRELRVYGLL